jgi:hypothetical protein
MHSIHHVGSSVVHGKVPGSSMVSERKQQATLPPAVHQEQQVAGGAGSSGADGSTDHYWEPAGSSSCDSIGKGKVDTAEVPTSIGRGKPVEPGDVEIEEEGGWPAGASCDLLERAGTEGGDQAELLAASHTRGGGGGGGSSSDEELQLLMSKRPCSRNRRDAALTLMELNW